MSDAFIGEVRAMPYDYVPAGWAPCDGRQLQISSNAALFSLLGTTYGGNGATLFALPKIPPMQGQKGMLQYCIALQGVFPRRT